VNPVLGSSCETYEVLNCLWRVKSEKVYLDFAVVGFD
jgi:hypothetical protein